ncbi:enoyl-CoA hydratase/isomerase family protein [Cryobacterium sp. Y82]|uniref:enoyl-CoA hydratase/isomerase family protein n=1 Tax=Cryobacterium sp. Y82 TaxID=2045017 RepID=UPI000CE3091F|nr:enoyl-CoA hydratase-related protein [Cryobacterium sp. Y82]
MYEELIARPDNGDGGHGSVEVYLEANVALVVLSDAPARNALSLSMWIRIAEVFDELRSEPGVRAVVIRGSGTAAFAAGANIAEFPENRLTASAATAYNDHLTRALRAVAAIEVPTIAMIRGFAVGGGCELSAACDLRIGSETAQIGIPIGRLGVILGLTETRLLTRHIGVNGLKRVLFSGRLFNAAESLQIGLLDEVVPDIELAAHIAVLLRTITGSSATTITAAKVVTDLAGALDDAAADRVQRLHVQAYDGDDLKEGVNAFLTKRRPIFTKAGA